VLLFKCTEGEEAFKQLQIVIGEILRALPPNSPLAAEVAATAQSLSGRVQANALFVATQLYWHMNASDKKGAHNRAPSKTSAIFAPATTSTHRCLRGEQQRLRAVVAAAAVVAAVLPQRPVLCVRRRRIASNLARRFGRLAVV
jgi:hypothetical protein